jgi:hypothetical protein
LLLVCIRTSHCQRPERSGIVPGSK